MVGVQTFTKSREVGWPDAYGWSVHVNCVGIFCWIVCPVERLTQVCARSLITGSFNLVSEGLPTLMLPAISVIAFHRMESNVLIRNQAGKDLHLLFLRQRKEPLSLVHDLICIFLIDPLEMLG